MYIIYGFSLLSEHMSAVPMSSGGILVEIRRDDFDVNDDGAPTIINDQSINAWSFI